MIDVTDLSKSYGPVRALREVSFHVEAGEIIGLLGPNGAGKTTMIQILTGYLQPDSGQVMVDGLDVLTETLEVQKRLGYLPENAPLYPELSVQSYLKMIADLRQVPTAEQPLRLSEAIRATGLADHLTRPIGELSKGYRQRVGLAQAKVEATCDRVIILLNGEVRADARLSELSATTDAVLLLGEGAPDAASDLRAIPGVQAVEANPTPDGREYRVRGSDGTDLRPAIYDLAREQDWPLRELRRDVRTLEAVFNELVTAAGNDPDALQGGVGA
jgi:ABC-2 type transport system ATP-binding protein